MKIKYLFILMVTMIAMVACKRQIERPQWDVDLLAPLIKSTINIKSLVADSTYILDKDRSIILVFKQPLDSFSLKGLDTFRIDPFYKKIKLSSLQLNTDTITQLITLGQIARQLLASTDQQMRIVGFVILANQGKRMDIPNFENIAAAALPFDVTQWFKYAVVKSGNLKVIITNKLPITVANIQFDLNNKTFIPKLVLSKTFTNIFPNTSQSETVPLDNKKIEGNLEVSIPDLDLIGGSNVLIDTNAALKIQVAISDILLEEADAIFPAQNVAVDTVEAPITMSPGIEAKEAILEKGKIRIKVLSTMQDSLYYTYKIPNAKSPQGQAFKIVGTIPPSKGGVATQYEYIAEFNGYKLDLRGAPGSEGVNAFYSDFSANIRYTGKPVFLSLVKDSIEISITMEDFKPSYLRGYIKQDTILEAVSAVDLFKNIRADALNFNKINLTLDIKNSFGITVDITPQYLKASNNRGQSAELVDDKLVMVKRGIVAAKDKPLTPSYLKLQTANAAPLLNIIPQSVAYKLRITTGQSLFEGGSKFYDDFAYSTSAIVPTLTIEAPLNFSAKKIVLQDTIPLSADFQKQVRSGKFTMLLKNGFPLKIILNMKFIDQWGIQKEILLSPQPIVEGIINTATQKVVAKTDTKLIYQLTTENMQKIAGADRLIIQAQFDTQPENTQIKIYHDYNLEVKIIGDLKYNIQ